MKTTHLAIAAAALLLLAPGPSFADSAFDDAQAKLKALAEAKRGKSAAMSFEEFKASVYKEPFEGGKYIVNGDTPIASEKLLREFYEHNVKNKPAEPTGDVAELLVHQVGGLDAVWNASQKHRLTYCVSTTFGQRHDKAAAAMKAATEAWEAVADVDFHYLAAEDGNCTPANNAVLFDVRPVDAGGQYLARAFFPNEGRATRNVLIDNTSFALDPNGKLTLAGVLRHELGHSLGFRHEHTRPDSGACFEDSNWRPLTNYDAFSVMHYPQCNGKGDWSLKLTESDKSGSACLYGPAPGFVINPALCKGRGSAEVTTESFDNQTVGKGEEHSYGPFRLVPGTQFKAEMSGAGSAAGDPDLYVKFDQLASRTEYDCRPYTGGADETCAIDVTGAVQGASVMVHGYAQGAYSLKVTYTKKN